MAEHGLTGLRLAPLLLCTLKGYKGLCLLLCTLCSPLFRVLLIPRWCHLLVDSLGPDLRCQERGVETEGRRHRDHRLTQCGSPFQLQRRRSIPSDCHDLGEAWVHRQRR